MVDDVGITPVRSFLFVPGNRTSWAAKAVDAGADGVILDLEDAVPADAKVEARRSVAELIRDAPPAAAVVVRINGLGSATALDDLEEVVRPGLQGVMVPKVEGPSDIEVVDRVLGWLEERVGLPVGAVRIVPVLETAAGIRRAYEVARSSARVAYMGGIATKGGDVERSVGYRWSPGGAETAAFRASALIDARAAGVPNPVTGMWAEVRDLDGLRRFAVESRDLGYEGMMAIHPSHVPVINEVFTPSQTELDADTALVEAMAAAVAQGRGAVVYDGQMIDEAMAATARLRLRRYRDRPASGAADGRDVS